MAEEDGQGHSGKRQVYDALEEMKQAYFGWGIDSPGKWSRTSLQRWIRGRARMRWVEPVATTETADDLVELEEPSGCLHSCVASCKPSAKDDAETLHQEQAASGEVPTDSSLAEDDTAEVDLAAEEERHKKQCCFNLCCGLFRPCCYMTASKADYKKVQVSKKLLSNNTSLHHLICHLHHTPISQIGLISPFTQSTTPISHFRLTVFFCLYRRTATTAQGGQVPRAHQAP
jgi:hypothetical protein